MDFETARDLAYEYYECLPGVCVHELRLVPEWAQEQRFEDVPPNCVGQWITLESVPGIEGWLATYLVDSNELFLVRDFSIARRK